MKKVLIIGLAVFLMLIPLMGVSCEFTGDDGSGNEDSEMPSGELPTLKVGDKWVFAVTSKGIGYARIIEVTGEEIIDEKNCYKVEASIEPPFMDMADSITMNIEKATMISVSGQSSGESNGIPFIIGIAYSFEYPLGQPYPIEVGKEIKEIKTKTTTKSSIGGTITEIVENTCIYKVEKIEEITVTAGTFNCFKVVKYDETGIIALETRWYSDKAKFEVKYINHETGDIEELQSYSVH